MRNSRQAEENAVHVLLIWCADWVGAEPKRLALLQKRGCRARCTHVYPRNLRPRDRRCRAGSAYYQIRSTVYRENLFVVQELALPSQKSPHGHKNVEMCSPNCCIINMFSTLVFLIPLVCCTLEIWQQPATWEAHASPQAARSPGIRPIRLYSCCRYQRRLIVSIALWATLMGSLEHIRSASTLGTWKQNLRYSTNAAIVKYRVSSVFPVYSGSKSTGKHINTYVRRQAWRGRNRATAAGAFH